MAKTPYVYQEFPRMIYKSSGETRIVHDAEAQASAVAEGFSDTPPRAPVEDAPAPVDEPPADVKPAKGKGKKGAQ